MSSLNPLRCRPFGSSPAATLASNVLRLIPSIAHACSLLTGTSTALSISSIRRSACSCDISHLPAFTLRPRAMRASPRSMLFSAFIILELEGSDDDERDSYNEHYHPCYSERSTEKVRPLNAYT